MFREFHNACVPCGYYHKDQLAWFAGFSYVANVVGFTIHRFLTHGNIYGYEPKPSIDGTFQLLCSSRSMNPDNWESESRLDKLGNILETIANGN